MNTDHFYAGAIRFQFPVALARTAGSQKEEKKSNTNAIVRDTKKKWRPTNGLFLNGMHAVAGVLRIF
jgi:hypothetical protein